MLKLEKQNKISIGFALRSGAISPLLLCLLFLFSQAEAQVKDKNNSSSSTITLPSQLPSQQLPSQQIPTPNLPQVIQPQTSSSQTKKDSTNFQNTNPQTTNTQIPNPGATLIAPRLPVPNSVNPAKTPDSFSAATNEPQTTPPLLTAIQPNQCVSPGSTISLNGRFNRDHLKHRAVMDGQTGHFHLNILSFAETAVSIEIPIAIDTSYPGPFALYLEHPQKHEADGNMLGDIWLCQSTADSSNNQNPSTGASNDNNQTRPSQPSQQNQPPTAPVTAPQRDDQTGNSNNNQTVGQNSNNQANPATNNNGGTLIGGGLPAPPNIPAANVVEEDDDSIEVEQVVIITATMEEAISLTDTMANEYGARVKTRENMENIGIVLNVFRLTAGQSVNQLLPVLRQRFTNLWIDSNQRFSLMSNDRKRYGQAALQWQPELGKCINSIGIGMIDTDVNLQHPSLQGVSIKTSNFIDRGETVADTDHGTAVAALIAGNPNTPEFQGLLPTVNIYAAGIFRQRGKERETTTEWLLKAINWITAQPVDVINLSLGGSRNIVVELALQKSMAQGKIIVAAAGNDGPNSAAVFPAAQEGVVAVTAVDAKQKRYRKANVGQYIDIAAPGVDIWVANQKGKGHYQSGTSYATPMVSAAIAAYVSKQQISYSNLQNKLPTLVNDIGPTGKDNEFGWGLMRWPVDCSNSLANSN